MTLPKLTFEGLPVREAKRGLKIKPGRADNRRAKRGDPACCVAAQCLKRTHAIEDVRVYRSRALVRPKGKNYWVRYHTPTRLAEEIRVFDKTGDFQGREFVFEPLPYWQSAEYRAKLNKKRGPNRDSTGKMKKHTRRHISAMTGLRGSPHFASAAN